MWGAIGFAFQFLVIFFQQIIKIREEKKAKNEKIEYNDKLYLEASERALVEMRGHARRERGTVSDVEDEVDRTNHP